MRKIIDCRPIRAHHKEQILSELSLFKENFGSDYQAPTLAIVQVGDRDDSNAYVNAKKKFGQDIGVNVIHIHFKESVKQSEIIEKIKQIDSDKNIHGIIVQLPLPISLDRDEIINSISSNKDVDGLGFENTAKLWEGREDAIIPATARGVLAIFKYENIELSAKKVAVVGRSTLVGRPVAMVCLHSNATVTICHSKTRDLSSITKESDIVIFATGKPLNFGKEYFKKDQIVIDIGITFVDDTSGEIDLKTGKTKKKMVGDVRFEEVKDILGAITPVPYGVGQMTVLSLFQNLISTYRKQKGII